MGEEVPPPPPLPACNGARPDEPPGISAPSAAAAGAAGDLAYRPLDRILAAADRAPERGSLCLQVPHVKQSHNWDCGLACVLMILQAFGVHTHSAASMRQICRTKSIWTVDLAHLLRHLTFEVTFLTVTLGANPDYATETFYQEHMEEDEERVARLFREAPSKGIALHECSLTQPQLQSLVLAGQHVLVMLIDKRVLSSWASESCSVLYGAQSLMLLSYTGHYVVICGFDTSSQQYSVCDPAGVSSPVRVPAECLETARRSFGTDEDILLVSHKQWRLRAAAAPAPTSPPPPPQCPCLRSCRCSVSSHREKLPRRAAAGSDQLKAVPPVGSTEGDGSGAGENFPLRRR